MEVRNCKSCGKMFQYDGRTPICGECLKKLDEKFKEVKEYIYEHPGTNVKAVSEELNIPQAHIKRWVREERLSFSDDSVESICCEKCGNHITTGRFCEKCKKSMVSRLSDTYAQPAAQPVEKDKKQKAKMRFLDN